MLGYKILYIMFILIPTYQADSDSMTGTVSLDEFSFDKLISKFDAVLVKFDISYPYGEKHDAYIALAKQAREIDELLIAEVAVKDYGEKDNEALARKYGATKDNFPVVKLFLKDKTEPITFDDSFGFNSEELSRFLRKNTDLYLSLPGCIRQLDLLAIEFMKADKENKQKILKQTEKIIKQIEGNKNSSSGVIYRTIMQKVLEKGEAFIIAEHERLKRLINEKIAEEKKSGMRIRLNVIKAFFISENESDSSEGRNEL